MKKILFSSLVAVAAISGAFASQTKGNSKLIDTYFEKPNCNIVQCDTPETGQACSELTLYLNCTDTSPVTSTPGFVVPQ